MFLAVWLLSVAYLAANLNHDPNEYRQAIEALLSRSDFVKVVVLKPRPSFSTRFVPILQSAVRGKFSESREIGDFEVYWRP